MEDVLVWDKLLDSILRKSVMMDLYLKNIFPPYKKITSV